MKRILTFLLLLATAIGCRAQAESDLVEVAFPELSFQRPIFLTAPDNEGTFLYVIEQQGRVLRFPNKRNVSPNKVNEILDIRNRVQDHNEGHNEEGLLGMALHPDFPKNPHIYLDYTAAQGPRRNIISEWTFDPESGKIDPGSERILMEIKQPYGNHNGGHLAFGPKGYLYITKGDGGSAGDPKENGQDPSTPLGAILRIDVDQKTGNRPYGIPEDNPFTNTSKALSEIYAFGLRNVWRFSFDAKTGALWAGDVGQNKYEEIDIVRNGKNYGWDIREGRHSFENEEPKTPLVDPVYEYGRDKGVSVTGGYVYRGEAIPELQGAYIFGDYGKDVIWALRHNGKKVTAVKRISSVPSPASFGEDRKNEIYICSFDGKIRKLVPPNK